MWGANFEIKSTDPTTKAWQNYPACKELSKPLITSTETGTFNYQNLNYRDSIKAQFVELYGIGLITDCRGGSRISVKRVHIHKGVGVRFAA